MVRHAAAGTAAAVLVGAIWAGCSLQKHHALLSFFFDGVPDPTLLRAGADAVEFAKRTGGVYYSHQPYAKNQCAECHVGGGTMLSTVESSSCLKCHTGVTEQHRYMHGPVAVAACLWCHAPHESTVKPMLRVSGDTLCRQCHDSSLSARRTIAAHADPARDCLECHSGHGGSERYFLHSTAPKRTTPAPSTPSPAMPPTEPAAPAGPPNATSPAGSPGEGEP